MFANLKRRLGEQAGAGQVAVIGAVLVLCLIAAPAIALTTGPSSRASAPRDFAAQGAALTASEAASTIAASHHGSYAHVSLLSLHKVSLVPLQPSSDRPWLSAASGTAHAYSLTLTAPDGDTYTITRATDGALTGTCHVNAEYGPGSGCLHIDASGAGVW